MTTIYMGKTASAFSQVPFKSGLEAAFCTYAVCMHAFLIFVIYTLHLYICFRVAHTWTRCTKQYSFSNKKFLTPKDAQLEILRKLSVKPYKKAAFPCPETTGSTERYLAALCSTFSNSKRFSTKWVFASSALLGFKSIRALPPGWMLSRVVSLLMTKIGTCTCWFQQGNGSGTSSKHLATASVFEQALSWHMPRGGREFKEAVNQPYFWCELRPKGNKPASFKN